MKDTKVVMFLERRVDYIRYMVLPVHIPGGYNLGIRMGYGYWMIILLIDMDIC